MLNKPQFFKKIISPASLGLFLPSTTIKPPQFLSSYKISHHYFSSFQPPKNYKDDLIFLQGLPREELTYVEGILNRYSTSQDLKTFDPEEIQSIPVLFQHFANAYKLQGNLQKAYSYINEAEEVYKRANIEDTFFVANNHFIKASMCMSVQDYTADIEYHFNEVDRICKILGNNPEAKSLRVQNLLTRADYHNKRNEKDEAFTLFNEIVQNKDQLVPEVLPHVMIPTYEELGFIYKSRSNPLKAIECWTKGLEVAIPNLGENSNKVFFFYCDLAEILYQSKRSQEALTYTNKALQVAHNIFPPNHAEIGWCYYLLGNVLNANSSPAEALKTYKKAFKIYEIQAQKDFPALSDIYFKAAMINYALENEQEASLFLDKSAQMLEESGTSNIDDVYLERARGLKENKRMKEYESYLKGALEFCKNYNPYNKPQIEKIYSLLEELAAQKQ